LRWQAELFDKLLTLVLGITFFIFYLPRFRRLRGAILRGKNVFSVDKNFVNGLMWRNFFQRKRKVTSEKFFSAQKFFGQYFR